MIGCASEIPIVASVIDLDCETVPLRFHLCRLQERGIRQQRPPARAVESGIIRFGCFLQCTPIKEFANGSWELLKQPVFLGNGMTITYGGGIRHGRAGG